MEVTRESLSFPPDQWLVLREVIQERLDRKGSFRFEGNWEYADYFGNLQPDEAGVVTVADEVLLHQSSRILALMAVVEEYSSEPPTPVGYFARFNFLRMARLRQRQDLGNRARWLGHQITDEVEIMSPFIQRLETLEPKHFLPSDHES